MSSQGNENRIDPALVITGLIVLLVLSFSIFESFYINIWVKIKIGELYTLNLFSFLLTDESAKIVSYYLDALSQPEKVAFLDKSKVLIVESRLLGIYTWIYPVIFFALGLKTLLTTKNKFNKPHTMETLLAQETKTIWRFNRHLLKYNPLDETDDITKGIYSIRLKEKQFCIENNLLFKVDEEDVYYIFDRAKALEIFAQQMGPKFFDITSLNDEESWLLASFVLYLDNQKKESFDILGDASFVYNDEMDRDYVNAKANAILVEHTQRKNFKKFDNEHAYVYTLLMRMFHEAKDMGEFSAAKFTWLKIHNRVLWFSLLDVGMTNTGSIEAAGPETHFQAEFGFNKRQAKPNVSAYVDYLQNLMREYTEKK